MFGFWKDGSREERTIYWEHIGNRAVRQGDWKLVRDVEDSSWALYDMKNDPAESRDVSSLHPVRVREMLEAYQSWAITHRVRPWKNPSKPRDAVQ
jgi:arylsulfatase